MSHLGTPYIYGGPNRLTGLDCSGFVIEVLMAAGLFHTGYDTTAQGLYTTASAAGHANVFELGALAFYGKSLIEVSHVALCLNSTSMIECGGGDHTTTTFEEAKKRGACVRIRPIKYRRDFLGTIMPIY